MIEVLNGETFSSTAIEEIIVPIERDGDTNRAAGHNLFQFVLVSGSVQTAVGESVKTRHRTYSTAGDKWQHTLQPNKNFEALPEGVDGCSNLHAKGVGTVTITW